jgi:hypothetical protein
MNCREEDDLERATEIQEKLRSWMDEGGHRDKDKDRAMRLEKEQQTESYPIAKMQQRMEKVLGQEQREREITRKEVALLRQELRIESEGLALLRRERSCARDELYKEQEARARDRSIVVELENLLAESIRREEVCREQLKSERKKVLQGEASKTKMDTQEEEHKMRRGSCERMRRRWRLNCIRPRRGRGGKMTRCWEGPNCWKMSFTGKQNGQMLWRLSCMG